MPQGNENKRLTARIEMTLTSIILNEKSQIDQRIHTA